MCPQLPVPAVIDLGGQVPQLAMRGGGWGHLWTADSPHDAYGTLPW